MKSNQRLFTTLVLSLTLGLAPFFPEPHLFGKVRWLLGGGKGMLAMDYFDLVLHGTPWFLFLSLLLSKVVSAGRNRQL